ncbi:hypothetical protein C8R45DRAFT_1219052 [Mycena sanguinolenta]|nr:hypothetical protein C8R45DRAFT_1219052 [Mycena sanguinolenta]
MSLAPESTLLGSCSFDGSPPLNTDIAGLGVRVSTYVQAFLAVILLSLSPSMADIYSQTFPFTIMNIAIMTTSITLGFSATPQITLQDAIIVWYFTIIILVILHMGGKKLQYRKKIDESTKSNMWDEVATLMSAAAMYILSAAFTLSFLRHHETFGSHPECNGAARLFIFSTFPVSRGWFIFMAVIYAFLLFVLALALIAKFFLVLFAFLGMGKTETELEAEREEARQQHLIRTPEYRWGIITCVLLAVWVAFTEITVIKNRFAPPDSPIWQFGQIFPLILLAIPLFITAKSIAERINRKPTRSPSPQDLESGGTDGAATESGPTSRVQPVSDQQQPGQESERKSVGQDSSDSKDV